ncbi:hypothetical protein [Bacillus sp. FJAT-27231]|uniref:hypothetical protein n=1 Tax=Bacillus sp. FJAT-27231 TaxID=1679168 RepID=UPI0012E0D62A|nr:hypothetical protein [Bacillus sp. FJAT-27231]
MTHRRVCTECNGLGRVPLIRGFLISKVCQHCHGFGNHSAYRFQSPSLGSEFSQEFTYK